MAKLRARRNHKERTQKQVPEAMSVSMGLSTHSSSGLQAKAEPSSLKTQSSLIALKTAQQFGHHLGQVSPDRPVRSRRRKRRRTDTHIQPQLTLGQPNDIYEQQADQKAAEVVASLDEQDTEATQKSKPVKRTGTQVQTLAHEPAPKRGTAANQTQERRIERQRGNGEALDKGVRKPMESAFGADFKGVRIHTDDPSDGLNQSFNSRAFTTGQDIFFKKGEYNPQSKDGKELLAHELTHVVQQNGRTIEKDAPIQKKDGDKNAEEKEEQPDPVGAIDKDKLFGDTATKTTTQSVGKGDQLFQEAEPTTTTKTGVGEVTTTEKSGKNFAGAGAAIQKLAQHDELTIKEATHALARAGAFGEAAAKKSLETSSGTTASAEGKASGSAGAEASALSATVKDAIDGLSVLASIYGKAGVGFDLSGAMQAATQVGGVNLAAQLNANLSVFAGVMAEAKGKFDIGRKGMALAGKVYGMAGAKSEGSAEGNLSVGALGLDGSAKYEAMAGAEAGAQGKIEIGLNGVALGGKAEAFAGAKVSGEASTALKFQGKILVKISGKLEAAAGVGGAVEGEFSYKNGKLTIKGELAAALGLGGGAGVTVEVDVEQIGDVILEKVRAAVTKKVIDRRSIADEDRKAMNLPPEEEQKVSQQLYDAVYPHFKAYGDKKAKLVKSTNILSNRKADHLVKRDRVQEILDKKILSKPDLEEKVKYKLADTVLKQAALDAFGDQLKPGELLIQAGIIRAFGVKSLQEYLGR